MFNKIEVSFGEGLENKAFQIIDNYAYEAYLINLLNYGLDSKECGLFSQDDPGEFENFNVNKVKTEGNVTSEQVLNSGFMKRRQFFIDSKRIVDVIIPLHVNPLLICL